MIHFAQNNDIIIGVDFGAVEAGVQYDAEG